MSESIQHCKDAVESGYWPLYRYNPLLQEGGNNPFQLDCKKITGDLFKFLSHENRFAAVMRRNPVHAKKHQERLQHQLDDRSKALSVLGLDELPTSLKAASPADSVTVLFGSETGNAEEQAKSLFAGIKARGIGDDRDEDRFYTGWDNWLPQLWKAIHAPDKPLVRVIPKPAFQIDYSAGDATPAVPNEKLVPAGATPLTLMENTLLTPEGYDRDIRHYVFKIKDTSVTYRVGDVLAIWPRNHTDQVRAQNAWLQPANCSLILEDWRSGAWALTAFLYGAG